MGHPRHMWSQAGAATSVAGAGASGDITILVDGVGWMVGIRADVVYESMGAASLGAVGSSFVVKKNGGVIGSIAPGETMPFSEPVNPDTRITVTYTIGAHGGTNDAVVMVQAGFAGKELADS